MNENERPFEVRVLVGAVRTLLANAEFSDGQGTILTQDAEETEKALADLSKPTRDEEKAASLAETGRCAYAALAEMVAMLECDYERLDELREERKALADEGAHHELLGFDKEHGEELKELQAAAGDCEDRDDAEHRIHEDPLSIEVRGDWYSPGNAHDDVGAPEEFRILLGTGGPAVRIIGELDANCEPKSATLQTQDWFLPWTDYRGKEVSEETLLTYCRCFYFGEG